MNIKEMLKPSLICLILLLVGMFLLYSYDLGNSSSGLFCDEAAIGFNSLCLSNNFHDENNHFLPLFIQSFEGYKNPVYIYITALIVKAFGLSVFTTRILAVICAVFTVLFLYLLTKKYFNQTIAITSSVFLVFMPGFFHIQRIAFELTTFSCFFLGFLYFLTLTLETKKLKFVFITLLFLILAWYSYVLTQVFILSTAALFIIFNAKNLKSWFIESYNYLKSRKMLSITLFIVILIFLIATIIPAIKEVKTSHYKNRVLWGHSIDKYDKCIQLQTIYTKAPFLKTPLSKSPMLVKMAIVSLYNYCRVYSMDFLFLKGDNVARHLIPNSGAVPLVCLFLLVAGIIYILENFNESRNKLILAGFIASGIPSILMIWQYQLTHVSHIYPFIAIMSSLGLYHIYNCINSDKIKVLVCSIVFISLLLQMFFYVHVYFSTYRGLTEYHWQTHRDEIVNYIKINSHKYRNIYVSGQIFQFQIHLLYYACVNGDFNTTNYQNYKLLPYGVKPLRHGFLQPNFQRDSIIEVYGNNSLFILNPDELKEMKSKKEFAYSTGQKQAVLKEFME